MEEFLSASKTALTNLSTYATVRIVLGNQTCDLDSAVCALAQGLCEYLDVRKKKEDNVAVIPILNIAEKEFRIKTEVVYYFRHHGISKNLLTFRDQINHLNGDSKGTKNKVEVVLVDHHALASEDGMLVNSVVGVIDHRPQDASWPWHGKTIHLETVGSCATLVARNLLIKHPEAVDAWLANFLRGPILVDTCNFSKTANRATPLDHEIMETLERISSLGTDRNEVYNAILTAKTDISELTCDDLIIRDLKFESGVPFVGFPMLVKDFLTLEGALPAVENFARSRKCVLVVLIGLDLKNDRVTRDIAVFSLSTNGLENKMSVTIGYPMLLEIFLSFEYSDLDLLGYASQGFRYRMSQGLKGYKEKPSFLTILVSRYKVIDALLGSTQPSLELTLEKRIHEENYNLSLYKQGNLCATRKQILPIIRETLAKEHVC